MGRSILLGLVTGTILSAVLLFALTLTLPLPQTGDGTSPAAEMPQADSPAAIEALASDTAPDHAPVSDAAALAPPSPAIDAPSAMDTAAPPPASIAGTGAVAPVPPSVNDASPVAEPAAADVATPALDAPATDVAPSADLMASPAPAGVTVPVLEPATEPMPTPQSVVEAAPQAVEVPPGSEFARAPNDILAVRPATDAAPAASAPPSAAPAVAPEPSATTLSTDPAARPIPPGGPEAPAVQMAEVAQPTVPRAEQPLPVPPPGMALAPMLPEATTRDAPATPDPLVLPGAAAPLPGAEAAPQTEIVLLPREAPQPGFEGTAAPGFSNAPGVAVNRLPSIGGAEAPAAQAVAPSVEAATMPLEAFRAAFLPTGGPLLALVLLDPGPDADIAALAAMGVPMTVALDPMRAGVAQDARLWRDAGFEVAILAAALPSGATPADVEVALAAWRRMLPEAVAVIEPPEPVLQANRILAQQLVAVLTREGLGLATQEGKGLNAAAQLAAAAGVPQVAIWRVIDGEGDKAAAILRYLDRAAFEAQRGSGVAVMLHAWPETLAGLVEWHASRKTGPELAPFSALALTTQ